MIKNTGKVWHTGRLICSVLLASLLSLCLLSSPANAASVISYNYQVTFDGITSVFDAGQTSRTLPAAFSRNNISLDYLRNGTAPSDFVRYNQVYATTSFIFRETFSNSLTNRPSYISCPTFSYRITTNYCESSVVEQTFGNYHYTVYNFFISGDVASVDSPNHMILQANIKNFSENDVVMWLTPVNVSIAPGERQDLRELITSSYQLQTLLTSIDSDLTSQTTILSTISSSISNIYNKVSEIDTRVLEVRNAILNSNSKLDDVSDALNEQNEREEQDRNDAEQVVDDSQDSAESASEEVGTATASLTQTIGSFAATFSTPSSNCRIPLNDLGPDGIFDIGSIDLCAIPDQMHSLITTILNLIAVAISIALAVNTFRMITEIIGMFAGVGFGYERHYQSADSWTTAGLINQWSSGHDFEA